MRRAVHLAPSAFLSSLHGTRELTDTLLPPGWRGEEAEDRALIVWGAMVGGASHPVAPACTSQRAWDSPVVLYSFNSLLTAAAQPVDKARLLASRSPGSGDWLQALPLANIGLRLDDQAVAIAVALRLGAPAVHAHVCACGAAVSSSGHHGLSCVRTRVRGGTADMQVQTTLFTAHYMLLASPLSLSRQVF